MDESPGPRSGLLPWLCASLIFVFAISLLAAHVPPRVRLLGLFSIGFGLLTGAITRWLSDRLQAGCSNSVIQLVAAGLTVGGLVGSTCEIVRLEMTQRPQSPQNGLAERLIREMESIPATDQKSSAVPQPIAEFRSYLSHRLRRLGDWSSPWPEVFWLGELIVAAMAAIWIAGKSQRKPVSTASP